MNNEERLGQPSTSLSRCSFGTDPRAVADFDATQFFPQFYIDNRDVV
jgi:hypothetical protein